jgi:hypothetical protein
MLVFIPPAMVAGVAILAGFVQFVPGFLRLAAVAAMVFDGFVKTMIGPGDAPLAIVIMGAQTRSASEEQKSSHCRTGQRDFCRSKNSRLKFYLHSSSLLQFEVRPKSRVVLKIAAR